MKNSDNNFRTLRQLLKLKQHEIPPPGYFHGFSDQVISRLRAGEGHAQSTTERLQEQAPWLAWVLQMFEAKPGVIGGFAASLVLLLVIGVIMSDKSDTIPTNVLTASAAADSQPVGALAAVTAPVLDSSAPAVGIVASTNPVTSLQPVTTLFGQSGGSPLFQSASFSASGN